MPEKTRRRKNNKNKRKNNRSNKSEQSPNKVSDNGLENKIESVNINEVGQSYNPEIIDLNSQLKVPNDGERVDEPSVTLSSNEAEKHMISENELLKCRDLDETCCTSSLDLMTMTEHEVDASYNTESIINNLNLNDVSEIIDISNAHCGKKNISDQKDSHTDILNKRDESLIEYLVESPDQKTVHNPKLSKNIKSKSVDNDDSPTIIEVTEEISSIYENDTSLPIIDSKNIIITDSDSDIEWQKTDDLKDSDIDFKNDVKILPVTSIPLNTAQCDKATILKTEDERSLRNFLQTLNLSTNPDDSNTLEIRAEIEHIINREIKHRLRKRGLADDFGFQKIGPSRSLTVIDEEGSSESSATSRRQSHISEKASDTDELEDEVFESKIKACKDKRSQIRPAHRTYPTFQTIPQECIRVDAKIKEPEITEARGSWAIKTTETLTGAELVYLTDSSSSTSSVYDLNEDKETSEDNDSSVRIITPTIEVTDAEKLLTNSCLMKTENNDNNKTQLNISNSITSNLTEQSKHNDQHEIVIESIDNIETNLYVKEISNDSLNSPVLKNIVNDAKPIIEDCPKVANKYDLEMKVIKCELNDAINNLIKEVTSDSECPSSENLLQRQDSSSSLGSSQCTAKYNPNHSSLNDVTDIISENHNETYTQLPHVKEVYERAACDKNTLANLSYLKTVKQPNTLKEVCLQKITSLPYGDKILEELANVSKCLQNMSLQNTKTFSTESKKVLESTKKYFTNKSNLERISIPPPIQPRTSSFKITKDEYNQEFLAYPARNIRCLSPSNKMLMEKTNTVIKDDKPRFSLPAENNLKHINDSPVYRDNNKKYQMKSETGSRLLSLLRDSSVKSNSSPFLYKSNTNDNLQKLSKIGFSESFHAYAKTNKSTLSKLESHENFMSDSFKHIPPPKLRSFSSSFYESDDSSDVTDNTLRKLHNEKRYFHYSTGNLNKEILNDVSSIQNMHRHYTNVRDAAEESRPRRPSLPKDLCDQQMEYIRKKEIEVDAELQRLERESTSNKNKRGPRAPMISEESFERRTLSSSFNKPLIKESIHSSRTEKRQISSVFSSSEEELRREKMYSEYISQMAEREKRREHKVIKITKPSPAESAKMSKSTTALDSMSRRINNPIEGEFISKAKERWNKLGITDPETEDEKDQNCDVYREPKVIEHKIKVIDAGEEKDVKKLPSHLQEFVSFTVKDTERRNSPGESDPEKPSMHVVVLSAVIILMLTVGRFLMRLIRNV